MIRVMVTFDDPFDAPFDDPFDGPFDDQTNEAGDPIEPFNLRNERDLGYFDTNGNFVWKASALLLVKYAGRYLGFIFLL